MSDLVDLKDVTSLVVAVNTPIATKEKILDALGDWKPVLTTDDEYCPDWSVITRAKTLTEVVEEHLAMHKLTPASCVNCGGRIDKDTMTCCYCGTYYR